MRPETAQARAQRAVTMNSARHPELVSGSPLDAEPSSAWRVGRSYGCWNEFSM